MDVVTGMSVPYTMETRVAHGSTTDLSMSHVCHESAARVCTESAVHGSALHCNAGRQKPHSRCGGYPSGVSCRSTSSVGFQMASLNLMHLSLRRSIVRLAQTPYPCSSLGVSGQCTPKFPRQHAHSPQSLCPHPPRWTRIAPCQLSFCNTTTTL